MEPASLPKPRKVLTGYGIKEDKPCSVCEKGNHKRASFKTKQNFSIGKCLHLLHMDLFGPVIPANLKESHLIAVNRIFRYSKGTSSFGMWYPKCSGFDLKGYSDSYYINEAMVEEKSTILKALNQVSKTLEADFVLKASMQKMAKTNTTASGNITDLTELLRNAKLLDIITQLNDFHTFLNTLSSQCASISDSLKDKSQFNQRPLRAAEGYIKKNPPGSLKFTTKEPGVEDVEEDPETENVEKEPEAEKPNRGHGIARDTDESPPKLVKASTKVCSNPDTLVLVPYEIHGKMYQLTEEQIQAHFDKEKKLENVTREARLGKFELINVVHEEATKVRVDPKALSSLKGCKEFIKQQDPELKVLK
nr:uncharacterized mitochondrial protein AtMg00810-like [Tanacetum cinerariifolium]